MRLPEMLQWSEGMLLTPQHFQQGDIYVHALLQHQMAQLEPHYWGLLDFKIDEAALRTGKVVVQSLHAVMPDGLVVQYPAADEASALVLDVAQEPRLRDNRPLKIHLAVPVRAEGAASRSASIQRYDSVKGTLAIDENTGEGRVQIPRLRPRLTLIAGDQAPAKYVALPLLELRRDLGGHFDATDYHPPLLRLSASRFLRDASLLRQLELFTTRIRAKAKELAGVTDNDSSPTNLSSYQRQVVSRLVAALPVLEVLVRAGTTHPFQAYLGLAQVVGQFAGVNGDPIPLLLDSYRHDDLAPGFIKAIRHLTAMLARLNAAYEATAFEHPQQNLFTYALDANARTERLIIELKPQAGQTAATLTQWLNQACIGSATRQASLRQRRIPGARARALPPEQAALLGVSAGGALYEILNQGIEENDTLVPAIQAGVPLHIHVNGNATPPAAIVLYTPNPRATKSNGSNGNGNDHGNGKRGGG